jgi:hypothetical protein
MGVLIVEQDAAFAVAYHPGRDRVVRGGEHPVDVGPGEEEQAAAGGSDHHQEDLDAFDEVLHLELRRVAAVELWFTGLRLMSSAEAVGSMRWALATAMAPMVKAVKAEARRV